MQEVSLSGSLRQSVGKKDAKALRNAGRVPAVVYGGNQEIHLSVNSIDLEKLVHTPVVSVVNIDIDGNKVKSVIQEVQYHPVTDKPVHVDFIELDDNRKVKVEIPINLIGRPIGVMNGGKLSQVFRKLKVYALPGELPDMIDIDISGVRIGGKVRVGDLADKGLEFLHNDQAVICMIKMARGAVDTGSEDEEGGEAAEGETSEAAAEAPAEGGEE